MARRARPSLEEILAALREVDGRSADGEARLRDALRSDAGVVIAAAARHVGEQNLDPLAGELPPAFERLLDDAVRRDPGCRGKIAIVKALHALDRWDDRVFAAGLRHVQPEGMLGRDGKRDDTAAELRGLCGIAHAQHGRHDALDVLAGLLADPEHITRTGAARGLGDAGRLDASALLRYKLLVGDEEPGVLAACAESLLGLARDSSVDFLVGLLAEHDERAEVVALALGTARIATTLDALTAWCMGASTEQRHRIGYLAIALLRSEAGNAYLLDLLATASRAGALAAARALATFKHDPALVDHVRAAAAARKDAAVAREIEGMLG